MADNNEIIETDTITSRDIAQVYNLPHPSNGVYIEWDMLVYADNTAEIVSASRRVKTDSDN